jgi:hypothetical protein
LSQDCLWIITVSTIRSPQRRRILASIETKACSFHNVKPEHGYNLPPNRLIH